MYYIYIYIYIIYSRIFENVPQDAPEYSHRKLVCGEKNHRGLAVLLGLIVKFSL